MTTMPEPQQAVVERIEAVLREHTLHDDGRKWICVMLSDVHPQRVLLCKWTRPYTRLFPDASHRAHLAAALASTLDEGPEETCQHVWLNSTESLRFCAECGATMRDGCGTTPLKAGTIPTPQNPATPGEVGPLADKVLADLDGYDDGEKADMLAVQYVMTKQWGQEKHLALRDLAAGVAALADEWDVRLNEKHGVSGYTHRHSDDLRALLAPVRDSEQAETAEEGS